MSRIIVVNKSPSLTVSWLIQSSRVAMGRRNTQIPKGWFVGSWLLKIPVVWPAFAFPYLFVSAFKSALPDGLSKAVIPCDVAKQGYHPTLNISAPTNEWISFSIWCLKPYLIPSGWSLNRFPKDGFNANHPQNVDDHDSPRFYQWIGMSP